MLNDPGGINEENRRRLETLHRDTSGPFTIEEAAAILPLGRTRTRKFLAYLVSRGWLARLKHGLYTTVPLGASVPSKWREDPWVVAMAAFSPCYIGGWSACEHWGFTEQIFRDIVVVTAAAVREKSVVVQDTVFRLTHRSKDRLFGTRVVWHDQHKIRLSDPSRTLVDILDEPALGGGIRHVAEVVVSYFGSDHRDDNQLLSYITKLGNRAVCKRLGYLLEALDVTAPGVIEQCYAMRSEGITVLDPGIDQKGRIVNRWNIRANAKL